MATESDLNKSMLVNWAYNVIKYNKKWPTNICEMPEVVEAWKNLKICNRYSNINYVDSIDQKLRCILTVSEEIPSDQLQATLGTAIENAELALAICEHNRWNLQQLLLGFTPCPREMDEKLCGLVAEGEMVAVDEMKSELKSSCERVHPNICDYMHLAKVDPDAQTYDAKLNTFIPRILMLVDGASKRI